MNKKDKKKVFCSYIKWIDLSQASPNEALIEQIKNCSEEEQLFKILQELNQNPPKFSKKVTSFQFSLLILNLGKLGSLESGYPKI